MIFTTNLTKKAEQYLSAPVEQETFFVIDVTVQKDKDAVALLAPIVKSKDPYFNLKYGETSKWFSTLEQMLDYATEQGYIKENSRKGITERYQEQQPKLYEEATKYGWKNR